MTRQRMILLTGVTAVLLMARPELVEGRQDWSNEDWCSEQHWGDDREGVCEVRKYTLSPGGIVSVDAAPNGGIQVQGGPRGDVLVPDASGDSGRSGGRVSVVRDGSRGVHARSHAALRMVGACGRTRTFVTFVTFVTRVGPHPTSHGFGHGRGRA